MKSIFRKVLLLIGLSVFFVSCGEYSQLLKSTDAQQVYNAALVYYQQKKNEKAIALFGMVEYHFAGTAKEDTIKFYTASSHFRRGDYFTSNELLQDFRRRFNRSPFIEEAEYLIALGYYYQSPDPELDQTPTQMARIAFLEYLARYPNSVKRDDILEYTAELQQKLYDKSFLNAKLYYDIGNYKSAIHTFKLALSEYPETTHREDILYLLTKASFILADNSIETLQHGRYLDMVDAYYNLISEYPETKHLGEVKTMYDKVQGIIQERNHEETNTPTQENNTTEE